MPASFRHSLPALLLALVLGTACVDALAPDVTITRVTMTPVTVTMAIGSTQQLTALARNRKSDPIPETPFVFESLQPAVATVNANGIVSAIGVGVATIRATTGTFVATSTITVQSVQCTNATATATISTSQTINGALTNTDCEFSGLGFADGYRFATSTPVTMFFTLTGATIRPKLSLTGALAADIVTDSWSTVLGDTVRLIATLNPGTYTLWVVENSDDLGPYTLVAQTAVACTAALATTPIALDQTVTGALTDTSCILPNDAEGMGWALNLSAETDVRFDIGADGFAPWIVITDSNLGIFSSSIPVGTDSAVLLDRLPAGNYTVWATTLEGGQGSFAMSRSTGVFTFCEAPGDTITVPGSISGSLSINDCVLEPGFFSDPILMNVLATTTLRIDLRSTDFDAVLAIADSTDTIVLVNDDGGGGTNSRIFTTFPAGRYTLLPQAYEPHSSGDYTLTVAVTAGINQGNVQLAPKPRVRVRSWPSRPKE